MSEPITDEGVRELDDDYLRDIRERLERATDGPWETDPGVDDKRPHRLNVQTSWKWQDQRRFKTGKRKGQLKYPPKKLPVACGILFPACFVADAEFIAHARTDVEVLLAEVERLRLREVARLRERLEAQP